MASADKTGLISPQKPSLYYSRLMLMMEWMWFAILLLPNIVLALYHQLFPPKAKSLKGKVVLVTGAAHGLGRELALAFARQGCTVACVDLDERNVLETAGEIARDGERAKAYVTNVANVDEVKTLRNAVTADLGPVDILVNNASVVYHQSLADTPDHVVRAAMDVNVLGYIWMVRAFLPDMKERYSGHIVAISSMAAHFGLANACLYASTKYAVNGFMKSMRLEVQGEGCDNIHFTTVCPAYMPTSQFATLLNSRLHELSRRPEEVAAHTVLAVRRNTIDISVLELLYYLCLMQNFLPTKLVDWAYKLVMGQRVPLSQDWRDKPEPPTKETAK